MKAGMTGVALAGLGLLLGLASGCQSSTACATGCCENRTPSPDRPAELKRLDALVGMWAGDSTVKMADGKTAAGKGKSCVSWEVDGNVLLERGEFTMGDQKMQGLGLWMWDAKAKKYQLFWYDSMGAVSHGDATYNEATKTFTMNFHSRNMTSGEATVGEGTSQMVDANTMSWSWTEWDAGKTKKVMEMTGTNKRQ